MKTTITYEFDTPEDARAHLDMMSRGDVSPVETPEPVTEPEPTRSVETPATEDGPTVDCDGMPFDPEIHSEGRAFNADGTWRAKRGHAEEAKRAKEAFKAGGGNVEAPDVTEAAPASAMPGATAMPSAPSATDEPVRFEVVVEKLTGMINRSVIDNEKIAELHQVYCGGDLSVYETNESARAGLYTALCEIEPELK